MADNRKWVYRSGWDFSLVIKPSQTKLVHDGHGHSQMFTEKGIKVHFTDGFLVVNEPLARHLNLPMETIVKWIGLQSDFGKRFHLIESPTMAVDQATKEKIEKDIVEAKQMKAIKVVQGARSTDKNG